jgi:hypothetical protein
MPFRCKCGRTFEKVESFGSHTSGCAPFHHRRISTSDILLSSSDTTVKKNHKKALSIQTTQDYQPQRRLSFLLSPILGQNNNAFSPSSSTSSPMIETPAPPTSSSTPIFESSSGFMMPTALSIQNTFEGVKKRRSMSYSNTSTTPTTSTQHPAAAFHG